tara:strand:- start:1687 stop:1956 length:270 start_codon:yes stop_codon:yes gene_type:complete
MAINRKNNNSVAWANALDQITKEQLKGKKPDGPGWNTFYEILDFMKIGQCRLRRQLRNGIKNGTILVFHGQDIGCDGKRRQKVWYKIKS